MERRRVILVALASIVVAGVVAVVWPREREPEYKGKRLSEWLVLYREPHDWTVGIAAREAVHEIGTNAIPWLLRSVRYEEPDWKRRFYYWMISWPRRLQPEFLEDRLDPQRFNRPDHLAIAGFDLLRMEARPALPELKRLLHDAKTPEVRWNAFKCLLLVGELRVDLMEDPDPVVRAAATNFFYQTPIE